MPEGGQWNIDLQPKSTINPDEYGAALLTIAAGGVGKDGLDKLVPPDMMLQSSALRAINKGPGDMMAVRRNILDGDAETFWQAEYVFVSGGQPSKLEVSLLITLDQTINAGKITLLPYQAISGSTPSARLQIGTNPSSLTEVESSGPCQWTFPAQDIKCVRLIMTETKSEVTPYPEMSVEFDRGMTYVSSEKAVPI
jgi:hypothetical protein